MNKLKKYFIYFSIAFLIIQVAESFVQKKPDIDEAERIYYEIISSQPTKAGQTKREAEIETAAKKARNMVVNSTGDTEKLENAVNIFRGFYLINVASRPKYCNQYGISIDNFVNGFKQKYSHEIKVMQNFENTVKAVPRSLLLEINELVDKQVKYEVESSSKQLNIRIVDYCQSFNDYAADYLKEIDLKARAPEVYELLNKK